MQLPLCVDKDGRDGMMGHGTWDLELGNYPNWPICSVTSELFYIILMFPKSFWKI